MLKESVAEVKSWYDPGMLKKETHTFLKSISFFSTAVELLEVTY